MNRFLFFAVLITASLFFNSCANEKSKDQHLWHWIEKEKAIVSAHRGGPAPQFPENHTATFENIVLQGAMIIECDIRKSKDGVLVLMHDKSLERTSTGSGLVEEKTLDELREFLLIDNEGVTTDYRIQTLEEILLWAKENKVYLTLDIKDNVEFKEVVDLIEKTNTLHYAGIITYSHKNALEVFHLNDSMVISVGIMHDEDFERFKKFGIPSQNLIAFTGTTLNDKEFYDKLDAAGIPAILGTLGNLDKKAEAKGDRLYVKWRKLGIDIFATDRPAEAFEALKPKLKE